MIIPVGRLAAILACTNGGRQVMIQADKELRLYEADTWRVLRSDVFVGGTLQGAFGATYMTLDGAIGAVDGQGRTLFETTEHFRRSATYTYVTADARSERWFLVQHTGRRYSMGGWNTGLEGWTRVGSEGPVHLSPSGDLHLVVSTERTTRSIVTTVRPADQLQTTMGACGRGVAAWGRTDGLALAWASRWDCSEQHGPSSLRLLKPSSGRILWERSFAERPLGITWAGSRWAVLSGDALWTVGPFGRIREMEVTGTPRDSYYGDHRIAACGEDVLAIAVEEGFELVTLNRSKRLELDK